MQSGPKLFVVWDERHPALEQVAQQVAELYPVVWLKRNGDPIEAARQAIERAELLFTLRLGSVSLELELLAGLAWASGLAVAGHGWQIPRGESTAKWLSSDQRDAIRRALDGRYRPKPTPPPKRHKRLFIGHGPELVEERARRRKAGWDTVDRLPYHPEEVLERASSASEIVWVRTEHDRLQYAQLVGAALARRIELQVFRLPGAAPLPLLAHIEQRWTGSSTDDRQEPFTELRIETLNLQNFRGIELLDVSFCSQTSLVGTWTCIAGINGAGKSTILQALALVLLGERLAHDLQSDRLQSLRRRDQDGNVYNAEVTVGVKIGQRTETLGLRIDDDGLSTTFEGKTLPGRMSAIWRQRERAQVLVSYGASRNLASYRDNRYDGQAIEVRRQMSLFDPHAQLVHASVFLEHDEGGPQLQTLLSELLPAVLYGTGLSVTATLEFVLEDGTNVAAVDLPDGFRSMVAWLADLCAAWLDKGGEPDPRDIAAIVLLDEIDLHLHPSLQRSLIPNLRRALPKIQWVVTTHSPLIISSFDRTEIRALDRKVEGGIRHLDRQVLGFSTDQVYAWLMDVQPRSAAIDEQLERAQTGDAEINRDELARVLRQTPTISAEQAALLQRRTSQLLANLEGDDDE